MLLFQHVAAAAITVAAALVVAANVHSTLALILACSLAITASPCVWGAMLAAPFAAVIRFLHMP